MHWAECYASTRAGKNLKFFKKRFRLLGFLGSFRSFRFLGFLVLMYAQSHAEDWTQDYDQEEGL